MIKYFLALNFTLTFQTISRSLCVSICVATMSFLLPTKKNIFFNAFWFYSEILVSEIKLQLMGKPFVVIFSLFWGNILHSLCGLVICGFLVFTIFCLSMKDIWSNKNIYNVDLLNDYNASTLLRLMNTDIDK